jgi:hypothetical protein
MTPADRKRFLALTYKEVLGDIQPKELRELEVLSKKRRVKLSPAAVKAVAAHNRKLRRRAKLEAALKATPMTAATLSHRLHDLAELLLKVPEASVVFTVTEPGVLWPEPPQPLETLTLSLNNEANAWVLDLRVGANELPQPAPTPCPIVGQVV